MSEWQPIRTPWRFLLAASVLATGWIIGVGAVSNGGAPLWEKAAWAVISGWALIYALVETGKAAVGRGPAK